MDISDTSSQVSRPTTEVNGQGTVPSAASGKPSDDDFDMFAQSRQSFEENLPRVKYVTVQLFFILPSYMFYEV